MINVLVLIAIYLSHPVLVHAAIVLNEISPRTDPEWIEVFNNGSEQTDLTGWYFKDASGTKKLIPSSDPLGGKAWLVVSGYSSWLNNTGPESLYLYNNQDLLIDSVSFDTTKEGTVVARIPDYVGSWYVDQNPTPQSTNSLPSPTPSPSPIQSHTPSPVPSPTVEPTIMAIAQTPTPKASPSPLASSVVSISPSTPKPSVPVQVALQATTQVGSVAGEMTEIDLSSYGIQADPSPTPQDTTSSSQMLLLNRSRLRFVLTIGAGFILVSLAIYIWHRQKSKGIIN